MTQLKELYKGKCLDDLEPLYLLPDLKKQNLKRLLESARKMFTMAEKNLIEGDEEMSYILFMRYFNLVDVIRKMPEYSTQKKFVMSVLGNNPKQEMAMDKTEALSASLKRRYELLAAEETLKEMHHHPIIENNVLPTTKQVDFDEKSTSVLTCQDLFRMTQDPSASLLLMDCRSKVDFSNSRMLYSCCLNVPEEVILPGMSAGKIQQQLEPSSRGLWASRAIKDHVLLMDWSCKGPEPSLHTAIWRLRDILQNWDPDVTYRSSIKILQGGYEQFLLMYPAQCTNPNVNPPRNSPQDSEMLEDIEYPSIHDIIMKDDVVYGSPSMKADGLVSRPDVDRSSKVIALQVYSEKHRMLDKLKESERLVEKYVANEQKLLEAENDWQNVTAQMDKTEVEEQKEVLLKQKQELLYKIFQLETNERDYKLENDRLRAEVEEFKKRELEMGQLVSEKETVSLEKRIETKLQERQQIDEQREKISQERAKQLAIARDQKRRYQERPSEEEEISRPKIPQFDRSVKPAIIREQETRVARDFSPVPGSSGRGLTGLKNLGNTCYMNSIMQCLSNTTSLAENFITNNYIKQINRANNTKGKVAEEVAALIKVMWSGHYKCVASKDLRYILGQYQNIFRGVQQQDSHEFLTILMDWLHSDLQTLRISEKSKNNAPTASEKAWLEFTKSCESCILQLFYGQIKSTVKCVECDAESATYECFSNLSLELPQMANRFTLEDCLKLYFSGERIKGWNCPNCKQKRDAIKKLSISKLPPILVIHLKRFYADTDAIGNLYKKKQNYVIFPLDNLDMSRHIANSESKTIGPKTYHLYAVSNHYGSMESGHYTAFCRSSVYKKWYKFDDQVVSTLDQSDVVSSAAYILFYTYLPEAPPPELIP